MRREERKREKKKFHEPSTKTFHTVRGTWPQRSAVHLPNQQTNTVLAVAWWSRTACFCSRLESKRPASNIFLDALVRSLRRCYMRKGGKLFPELQRYGKNHECDFDFRWHLAHSCRKDMGCNQVYHILGFDILIVLCASRSKKEWEPTNPKFWWHTVTGPWIPRVFFAHVCSLNQVLFCCWRKKIK